MPFPKTIGQADDKPRHKFLFPAASAEALVDASPRLTTVVVVMENDRKSKEAARKLCEKHASDTLCVEWNPEDTQWRAVTQPDGQPIDPRSLQLDSQAKLVMVGHFREDQTMATQAPEVLATALVKLLQELKVTAPRKISLTGVCYTAPDTAALDAAADSLAGRFVSTLHEKGIATPVTSIDGEVIVNAQGRKETVSFDGMTEPARRHKVILTVDDAGVLAAQASHPDRNASVLRAKPSPAQQQSPLKPLDLRTIRTMQRIGERKAPIAERHSSPLPASTLNAAPANKNGEEPGVASMLPPLFVHNPLKL